MQKDTSRQPSTVPLASNTALGGSRLSSVSGIPNKSDTGSRAFPKPHRRPSMSRVILEAVADKGAHHRMSLAALKKAVTTTGYDMSRNAWRFKRVLKGLVDNGMLKQVTGKGVSGSFRIGKKQTSKSKLKLKNRQPLRRRQSGQRRRGQRQRPGQRRPGQRRAGQRRAGQRRAGQWRRPGQRRPGQHWSLLGSRRGHKRIHRVARCRRN